MAEISGGVDDSGTKASNVSMERKKQGSRAEGEMLIPGIPNEITMAQISPKLPWKAFHVLSAVSVAWRRAIQGYQVYDARVRSSSTQSLIAVIHESCYTELNERKRNERSRSLQGRSLSTGHFEEDDVFFTDEADSGSEDELSIIRPVVLSDSDPWRALAISLYSIEEDSYYDLPTIPGVERGIPSGCQCIYLLGKIYILGGCKDSYRSSSEVYMLDLAGQRYWKQCASMASPRIEFGCGIVDGKIYVAGGTFSDYPLDAAEVYDPEKDSWSPIKPMPTFRFNHYVTSVGEELYMHSGEFYDSEFYEWQHNSTFDVDDDSSDDDRLSDHIHEAFYAEIYHPGKNEWRIVHDFTRLPHAEVIVMIGGKLHKMDQSGVHAYDLAANSWKLTQPYSFRVLFPGSCCHLHPVAAVALNGELFALVRAAERRGKIYFLRSEGLGAGNTEIVWHKIRCSLFLDETLFMCPVQL